MSILKQARLVESRKEGSWACDRLPSDDLLPMVQQAMDWIFGQLANDPRIEPAPRSASAVRPAAPRTGPVAEVLGPLQKKIGVRSCHLTYAGPPRFFAGVWKAVPYAAHQADRAKLLVRNARRGQVQPVDALQPRQHFQQFVGNEKGDILLFRVRCGKK